MRVRVRVRVQIFSAVHLKSFSTSELGWVRVRVRVSGLPLKELLLLRNRVGRFQLRVMVRTRVMETLRVRVLVV